MNIFESQFDSIFKSNAEPASPVVRQLPTVGEFHAGKTVAALHDRGTFQSPRQHNGDNRQSAKGSS